jgi:N-acetylgalactosamine kinase
MSQGSRASGSPEDEQRASRLIDRFRAMTGRSAALVVRAPGRVNLLGEHTDYNGLPVLPMAIDCSVLIAAAQRADRLVRLLNADARYQPRQYALADSIPPSPSGDWSNYAKAAAQGVLRAYPMQIQHGADLVIDGNIPAGAGLSSSSALVVASALALLGANDVDVPYDVLAELLPTAERYVGTLSGGMDQAACLLARAGHALRIDFFPLRVRTVPLPAGYRVVVCHSLVQAEKSGAARHAYNQRVIECRLVTRVLERLLGTSLPRGLSTLGDLVALFPNRSLLDFLPCLTAQVPDRPLDIREIAALIGTCPDRLRDECGSVAEEFVLLRRARHVFSEAERVNAAEEALRAGDAAAFGRLMDASHTSCRDDYDVSCPELEELIRIAKEAGALGARLTGAGFGGCTVNLVAHAGVAAFLTRVDRYFYQSRLPHSERVGNYRFIFEAQNGAEVVRL